jgi:hypothetical protein
MVKLVYCVRRKEGMTREEFQARWLDVHGPLAKSLREQLPMMKRYVQSHTIAQEVNDGFCASRGTGEAYDGITEMWLDSLDDMMADHGAEAAAAMQALYEDECDFIHFARSSIFMTEEKEIFA